MKNIITIGGSISQKSINKRLAEFAGRHLTKLNQMEDAKVTNLDLNNFEMPIFSVDKEAASGFPDKALEFVELIKNSDGIILSIAENNGTYSSGFKNILDWGSRAANPIWADKPMFLLGTSPGGRGALTVLTLARDYFPRMGAKIDATFSLPSFYDNFGEEIIKDPELMKNFEAELEKFKIQL